MSRDGPDRKLSEIRVRNLHAIMIASQATLRANQWTLHAVASDHRCVDDEQHDVRIHATPIRHVLFDADGVLQDVPGGYQAAAVPYLGERAMEFLHRAWDDELPALAGQCELLPLVAAALADFGVTVPLEEVFRAIWLRIEPAEESLALVRTLRRNGYGVHLGTNQERNRATHMREVLGYDALFDVSCYSWELGARKPDPAFFVEAARRIGDDPAAILFIDDSARNIAAARGVGLAAEQWTFADGHAILLDLLAKHGVACT